MTGETQPPRLPKVTIEPDTEPAKLRVMSLHVVHRIAEAARLKPAPPARSSAARLLDAVWLPATSKIADKPIPTQTMRCRPVRFPNFTATRSASQPHSGTMNIVARNGADVHQLAFDASNPRTRTR